MRLSKALREQIIRPVITLTASTEIERKAHEAEQNRIRLAAYYRKRRALNNNLIRLPLKHTHVFPHGRVIGGGL